MSVSDFLFEGRPPPSVTTYGETVENMPKWLSDYTQGTIGRANAIAAEPYQTFPGPRVAEFNPDQEAAFGAARANVRSYEPYHRKAFGALNRSEDAVNDATRGFPGAVKSYMDPFVGHVLERQQALSQRNLEENFLPSLQNAFTGAGQFGSSRMEDLGIRGTRDIAEGLQGQQLAALSGAYGKAGELFGADRGREMQGAGALRQIAGMSGDLGTARQAAGLKDAAALETIGATRQAQDQTSLNLGYEDFARQRDYPRENVDWLSAVVRGMPYDSRRGTTEHGPLGNAYQPSGASQLGSLVTTGMGVWDLLKDDKAKGGPVHRYNRGGALARRYN